MSSMYLENFYLFSVWYSRDSGVHMSDVVCESKMGVDNSQIYKAKVT